MPAAINLLVQVCLGLLVFAVGLQSRWQDLFHVVRQPRLLLSAILAVNIVVPAVMVAMVLILPIAPITASGLIAMAIAPMAPFLPGKLVKLGDRPFAIGLYVALIVIAIVAVPISVWAVDQIAEREVGLPAGPLARMVLTSILLPLLAGIAVGALLPNHGARLSRIATIAVFVVLLPIVALLLVKSAGGLASLIGDGTLLAIAVTVIVGMTLGHALGGRDPANQMAMAQAAVTRHPGIAGLIIASNGIDRRAMLAVILFLLASLVISTLYGKWLASRIEARASAVQATS